METPFDFIEFVAELIILARQVPRSRNLATSVLYRSVGIEPLLKRGTGLEPPFNNQMLILHQRVHILSTFLIQRSNI